MNLLDIHLSRILTIDEIYLLSRVTFSISDTFSTGPNTHYCPSLFSEICSYGRVNPQYPALHL